jgi:hypothetical protein
MRGVNRLRSVSQDYLLPLVIGALALRALIPIGFMPGDGNPLRIAATLCVPVVAPADGIPRTEQIEIPGTAHAQQCEYCLSPLAGPAFQLPAGNVLVAGRFDVPRAGAEAPHSRFALVRAQIPRAPPAA